MTRYYFIVRPKVDQRAAAHRNRPKPMQLFLEVVLEFATVLAVVAEVPFTTAVTFVGLIEPDRNTCTTVSTPTSGTWTHDCRVCNTAHTVSRFTNQCL